MGKGQPPPSPSFSDDVEAGSKKHKQGRHRHGRHGSPEYFTQPAAKPWRAWLVYLIFVANIVMFGVTMYVNNCPKTNGADQCILYKYLGRFSFEPRSENPQFGPSVATLIDLGANDWRLVVEKKELWRFLSCMWLHVGVVHIATNMLSLLFIGIRQEQEFGFLRVGLSYMLSGFGGSLMSALHYQKKSGNTPAISVGASGALFGLLGAMLSEFFTNWSNYTNKVVSLLLLGVIIAANLLVGRFVPHVDNSAHYGGFIAGFLLGFILFMRPQFGYISRKHVPPGYDHIKSKNSKYKWYQYLFFTIALVILIVLYAIGLIRLFDGRKFDSPFYSWL